MTIVKSEPGSKLYIEITDLPHIINPVSLKMGGSVSGAADDLLNKIRDLGESVGSTCATLFTSAIDKLGNVKPSELSIEFGISLGGEAGVPFVTKGHAEGTFKITATWKPSEGAPTAQTAKLSIDAPTANS